MGIGKKWKELLDVTDKITFTNHVTNVLVLKLIIILFMFILSCGLLNVVYLFVTCRMIQEEVGSLSETKTQEEYEICLFLA